MSNAITFPTTIDEMYKQDVCRDILLRYRLNQRDTEPLDKYFSHCIAVRFLTYSKFKHCSRTLPGYHSTVVAIRRAIASSDYEVGSGFPPSIRSIELLATKICHHLKQDQKYSVKASLMRCFLADIYGFRTYTELSTFITTHNEIRDKGFKYKILSFPGSQRADWHKVTLMRRYDASTHSIYMHKIHGNDGYRYIINILPADGNYLSMPYQFTSVRNALEALTSWFLTKYGKNHWECAVRYELAARKFNAIA
ncbi:hypothetical protein EDB60_103256 [Vibrio crassostreae]|nr:hypothetical protein EDB60_103256 [Vibrio crassostreae]